MDGIVLIHLCHSTVHSLRREYNDFPLSDSVSQSVSQSLRYCEKLIQQLS